MKFFRFSIALATKDQLVGSLRGKQLHYLAQLLSGRIENYSPKRPPVPRF